MKPTYYSYDPESESYSTKPVMINGKEGGEMPLDQFQNYMYSKEYGGDTKNVCTGNENPEAHATQSYPTFEDYMNSKYQPSESEQKLIPPQEHYITLPQNREKEFMEEEVGILEPEDEEPSYD